jgi:hypothetical protein
MLLPYFRFHRGLTKDLCRTARGCILDFQRTALGLPEGVGGAVMASIPPLYTSTSIPPAPWWLKGFLHDRGCFMSCLRSAWRRWRNTGFNIHHSLRIAPSSRKDLERLFQYIIRNPFSVEKIHPNATGEIDLLPLGPQS